MKQLLPTQPLRQRAGQKGMQTAPKKCRAEKETKSLPTVSWARKGRHWALRTRTLAVQRLQVLISESPKEETSTVVGSQLYKANLSWLPVPSHEQ
jgi:hypothetical protein